ncbi:MAG TPA: TRAP transporter fused permease subunit [Solirubrobacteraceae bacterium]
MSATTTSTQTGTVTDAARAVAPRLEDDQAQSSRRLSGPVGIVVTTLCCALALLAVKQVFWPSGDGIQHYLSLFLAGALPLTFLLFPARSARSPPAARDDSRPERPSALDWALAAAGAVTALYPIVTGFDAFLNRQALPSLTDIAMGVVLLVLILEATRRTTGWTLPAICLVFLAYAYYGSELPQDWSIAHAGFDVSEIVNALYMGTSGFFGTPLDVAASYIVLFTIYGAVLNASGAGRFFVDLSFAAFRRSRAAPGRTVTMAGFLLGTVSGSGTATAVSLGSVSWPILRRAGYTPEQAGGVLAAAGIGAILSPPTLGAAAFIIAEYLQTSYLTVLVYATIPTLLYYLGIILAVEMDARRHGARPVEVHTPPAGSLLLRFGYHFLSLAAIVVFMALGLSAMRAVVYATALAFALSFLDHAHRIGPRRLVETLADGARGALAVVATCAAAGIIVAMVTLTGLGLNLAAIIVDTAGALADDRTLVLLLTAVFAGGAITLLGLAVPVTASFIIAAVIVGPALKSLGVADPAVYMFIFYYAVLSEVSPPTALAAVAAAAITGGNALATMMQTLKYALPAFLVPLAFVLTDNGEALLAQGAMAQILAATASSALAVIALAIATGGWLRGPAGWPERALCIPAALLLLYLEPTTIVAGVCCLTLAVGMHLLRRAPASAALLTSPPHIQSRSKERR